MQAQATVKFLRASPRKLRLVADAVKQFDAETAISRLRLVPKHAAEPLAKALKQVVANAKQVGLSSPLKITYLSIDKGPIYKRWQPVSRGQVHSIHKPTAHIKVTVESEQAKPMVKQESKKAIKQESKNTAEPKNSKAEKPATKNANRKEKTEGRKLKLK